MTNKYKLLIVLLLSFTLPACKKHNGEQSMLIGNWVSINNANYGVNVMTNDAHFNENGDVIQRTYLRSSIDGKILGFYSKREAKYHENGSTLELTSIREYENTSDPNNFVAEKDLTKKDGPTSLNIPFSVIDNSTVLTLGNPCPPNANCINPYFVYQKVQ